MLESAQLNCMLHNENLNVLESYRVCIIYAIDWLLHVRPQKKKIPTISIFIETRPFIHYCTEMFHSCWCWDDIKNRNIENKKSIS